MSPTKRASSVAGLWTAVGPAPVATPAEAPAPVRKEFTGAGLRGPARVTLNMPPELYRELDRWTNDAAEAASSSCGLSSSAGVRVNKVSSAKLPLTASI